MSSAIFSFVKTSENSIVASVRIARWLSERYGIPLYDQRNFEQLKGQKLDLLIFMGGVFTFCDVLQDVAPLVLSAKHIVWIQNDYKIAPPPALGNAESPFRRAFVQRHKAGFPDVDMWTTCERSVHATIYSRYINWNVFAFDPDYDEGEIERRRSGANKNLLYYGSWRSAASERKRMVMRNGQKSWDGTRVPFVGKQGRDASFDCYFKEPWVDTTISSPGKNNYPNNNFVSRYPLCYHVGPFRDNLYATIGYYGLGLYIEDVATHKEYHSPANRFYEMLSAGLPMVFEPNAVKMLGRAGYDVRPYVAATAASVKDFMKNANDIGREQRKQWATMWREHRSILDEQVDEAMEATAMGLTDSNAQPIERQQP